MKLTRILGVDFLDRLFFFHSPQASRDRFAPFLVSAFAVPHVYPSALQCFLRLCEEEMLATGRAEFSLNQLQAIFDGQETFGRQLTRPGKFVFSLGLYFHCFS
jgi:hypothetical protein